MKILFLFGTGLILASCASAPPDNRRVVSIGTAAERDPENEPSTGVYGSRSGSNLYVQVTNLRQRLNQLEREQYEKKRTLDYYKRKNEETEAANDKLRSDLNHGIITTDPTVTPVLREPEANMGARPIRADVLPVKVGDIERYQAPATPGDNFAHVPSSPGLQTAQPNLPSPIGGEYDSYNAGPKAYTPPTAAQREPASSLPVPANEEETQ